MGGDALADHRNTEILKLTDLVSDKRLGEVTASWGTGAAPILVLKL